MEFLTPESLRHDYDRAYGPYQQPTMKTLSPESLRRAYDRAYGAYRQPIWATAKISRSKPVSRISFPSGPGSRWMPRGIRLGLGQAPVRTPAESVDILTAVRTLYGAYVNVEPLVSFLGNHPMMTLSMLMLAILAGGAVGGYIGAGLKTAK